MESVCDECKHTFKRFSDLRKHVKKFHAEKLEELAPLKVKSYSFQCTLCQKNFNDKRNLNMHIRTHSTTRNSSVPNNQKNENLSDSAMLTIENVGKKCPLCDYVGKFKVEFIKHFQLAHDIDIDTNVEKQSFSSSNNFNVWLSNIEKETLTKYIIEKRAESKHKICVSYICHRSGFFKSRSAGIRYLKTQGSKKINGYCPAGLQVLIDKEGGNHEVTYVKSHVGHQNDLSHLFLTKAEREMIAAKIAMKIPFDAILDDIRDSVSTSNLERLHLLKKKDVFNIEACFNLHSVSQRHSNDALSVDAWVEEMKSSCVLFYKPQGIFLDKHPQLKNDDFMLIIMTDGQKTILESFSKDCLCIDGTHGLNGYNFELHTLLVLDELRQGFPCAFCISNRSDKIVMNIFFTYIREEVGLIQANVFMSDMADVYYSAWLEVMSPVPYRLYCSWHVDRAWRKNLHLINLRDKQIAVYKMLRTLMQETDSTAFERMIKECIAKLYEDPETTQFANYFKNQYVKNSRSWAYSYRAHCGLNTNMHIERMHKSIKYIYLRGKNVQRLDKAIGALMKLVRDRLFDRLIMLNKGKVSSKLTELRKRHQLSLTLDTSSVTGIQEGIWQILSDSLPQNLYTVCENSNRCDCQLNCNKCECCIHKYSCDCIDSSIRWNMCKHVHLLCRFLQTEKLTKEVLSPAIETEEFNNQQLNIFENSKLVESSVILNHLQAKESTISQVKRTLPDRKRELIEKMINEINTIESEKELLTAEKVLASLGPTLRAVRQEADISIGQHSTLNKTVSRTKKIEQQRRLFSTKKKNKLNNNRILKPNLEEQETIAINLLL